jgi:hypothetical protein
MISGPPLKILNYYRASSSIFEGGFDVAHEHGKREGEWSDSPHL